MIFKNIFLIWEAKRKTHRCADRNLLSCDSLQTLQQPGLGWIRARSWELQVRCRPPVAWQELGAWSAGSTGLQWAAGERSRRVVLDPVLWRGTETSLLLDHTLTPVRTVTEWRKVRPDFTERLLFLFEILSFCKCVNYLDYVTDEVFFIYLFL